MEPSEVRSVVSDSDAACHVAVSPALSIHDASIAECLYAHAKVHDATLKFCSGRTERMKLRWCALVN